MHRFPLLSLLEKYTSEYEEELVYKADIIDFVKKHTTCFERSNEEGHITASAWLQSKEGSHALLMHHAKLDRWMQLGGHCDGDSDVLSVALNEASEESGICSIAPVSEEIFDIDVHQIPAHKGVGEHIHFDIRFLLQVTSDEDFVINHESKELRWISKNRGSLPTNERSVTRMHEKWCRLQTTLKPMGYSQYNSLSERSF